MRAAAGALIAEPCQPPSLLKIFPQDFTEDEMCWFFAYLKIEAPEAFERALHQISEDRRAARAAP